MKAKFSGHDTFPLRYGWLYKAVNHLNNGHLFKNSNKTSTQQAVVELGVGKNMVNAIKYWSEASQILTETVQGSDSSVTDIGAYLFGRANTNGKDPYLEELGSVWLIHFLLCFNESSLTAYRYFFNYSNVQNFDKSKLLEDFKVDAEKLTNSSDLSESTLKKDLDCFLHTYCKKHTVVNVRKKGNITEEYFTSPLAELGLLFDKGSGFYTSPFKEQPELPIQIFIYALLLFINLKRTDSNILSIEFDSLLSMPLSPGKIFRLSEHGLGLLLDKAQELTNNRIMWVDSLGLRQVQCDETLLKEPIKFLNDYYQG